MKPVAEAVQAALSQRRSRGQDRLLRLWQYWDMVMGEEIAPLALPLGHRRDILLVGAEDSLALQDLRFLTSEMLERVNAFMEEPFFRKIELSLCANRTNVARLPVLTLPRLGPYIPPKPARLGTLRGKIDPTSPAGRAYEAYVRMYERLDGEE